MKTSQGLCAVLLSTLVSIPAMADVGNIYAAGKFGLSWEELRSISDNYPSSDRTLTKKSAKENVLAYGGAVGYKWNYFLVPIRTEVDYTFRNGLTYNANPVFVGETDSIKSNVKSQTILANIFVDIPVVDMFGFFIGGGGGAALTTTENKVTTTTDVLRTDTDRIGAAWMASAGMSVFPTDWLALDLAYRYSNLNAAFWDVPGTTTDLKSHNYTANEVFLSVRLMIPDMQTGVTKPNPYQPKVWKEPAPQPKPVTKAPAYNKAPNYNKSPEYNAERARRMKEGSSNKDK